MAAAPSQHIIPLKKLLEDDDEEGGGRGLLTQESKDLLASLPRDKGWILGHLHQYQGFWFPSTQLQGVLACKRRFQAHHNDLLLVTTPKSGTTWLKALAFAIVNRVRYTNYTTQHPLLTTNPHELVPFLDREYIGINDHQSPDLTRFVSPVDCRLFSTHVPYVLLPESVKESTSKCKLVYLCRNPKDTLISLWKFANKLRQQIDNTLEPNSLEEVFESFCRGVSLFGPIWDHVLGYWKESLERPERVYFLKYEEIKKEPKINLKRLAEFLGYPFSMEEESEGVVEEIIRLCSFKNLSNLEVNKTGKLPLGPENNFFFRRGEVGDYVNYLTPEMIKRLDQITSEKYQGFRLKF
ncbi:Sulfotransferase domain [Macleaya cordata]|uniref:Sulfotransferase n=1 Tax=Macleaya cordata TaxID=56857 RepID=A0A200R2J2_MACCD|nr:Sulfotransferase domain [Macleaya cordata]OVA18828.1 Sulfotransferase domain [Macleaya cordata]